MFVFCLGGASIVCIKCHVRRSFREEHVALGLFRGDASGCYGNRTLFPLQPSSALKPRRGLESRKKLQKDVTVGYCRFEIKNITPSALKYSR